MRLGAAMLFGVALGLANSAHAQTTDNSNNAQADQPATDGDTTKGSKTETFIPRVLTDKDTLIATDEQKKATAKATAEAEQAAIIAELDKQLLGSWGRISSRSAVGISEASIITGANQCLRTRKITKPEYADNAEKALPVENERRGNIVFYRTEKGLQRLDTALRRVFLISKIEKQPKTKTRPVVWKLGTTKGSVLLGFGTVKLKGRQFPVLIEQNAVYVRCTSPKTSG